MTRSHCSSQTLFAGLVLALVSGATVSAQTVQDQYNLPLANPCEGVCTFGAPDVGWFYTPTHSYLLSGVNTEFQSGDSRLVWFELLTAPPPDGGTLLRTNPFDAASAIGQIGGVTFNPILVSEGTEYFVGFRNVRGLGINFALSGGTPVGEIRFSSASETSGLYDVGSVNDYDMARLQFIGTDIVPEPATITMLVTGLIGFGLVRRRIRAGPNTSAGGALDAL